MFPCKCHFVSTFKHLIEKTIFPYCSLKFFTCSALHMLLCDWFFYCLSQSDMQSASMYLHVVWLPTCCHCSFKIYFFVIALRQQFSSYVYSFNWIYGFLKWRWICAQNSGCCLSNSLNSKFFHCNHKCESSNVFSNHDFKRTPTNNNTWYFLLIVEWLVNASTLKYKHILH